MTNPGPITIDGPPGVNDLVFHSLHGFEELGQPFQYELEVSCEKTVLVSQRFLAQLMTVHLELGDGRLRHFNGHVTAVETIGSTDERASFRLTVRPWLWFLGRARNCRIFQQLSVPEILKQVFQGHGFSGFEEALIERYPKLDFVVQYRETDLDFVSRLLEEEGIYFFFRHEAGAHVLVLCDSYSSHENVGSSLQYFPPDRQRLHHFDHIDNWVARQVIQSDAYTLSDFNFERPSAALLQTRASEQDQLTTKLEVYDYPGGYQEAAVGDAYVRVRLEEVRSKEQRIEGGGNAREIATGKLFKLELHPDDEQNIEYLVMRAEYTLNNHDIHSGDVDERDIFRVTFSGLASGQPFRPPRRTPKPRIHGAQTAIVVGKAGEEIWTDQYGRVKVKFHWDRSEDRESSSCWIRVAQLWAGGSWGGMHIPRIGQEVIVEFLNGDPDRPIIVGRVYNGENAVPYPLPTNQTQSGLKSRSTKGGTPNNFNELRFEDKLGAEQVFMQAEKNYDLLVKNDATQKIGRDESHTVGRDRSKTVQGNEMVVVEMNRIETVIANETIAIGANRTEAVGANETIDIGEARTTTVGAADSLTIGGARNLNVGKDETIEIQGNRSDAIQKDETVTVNGKRSHTVAKDHVLDVGKRFVINVGDETVLKTGKATITLKKNGDIVIKGNNITLDGTGKIRLKSSSDISLKGSKVSEN